MNNTIPYCPLLSKPGKPLECTVECAWSLENGECAIKAIGEYCAASCQDNETPDED